MAGAVSLGWITLLTFAATPLLLRNLGAATYGTWVLLTVVLLQGRGLASLLDLGLQQSLIQRIAATDDHDAAGRSLRAGVVVLAAIGIVAGAILALTAGPVVSAFKVGTAHDAAVAGLRLLAVQLALDLPVIAFSSALEGLRRYEVRRALDAARTTIFVTLAVGAAVTGHGVAALAAASLASAVVVGALTIAGVHRAGLRLQPGGSALAEVRAAAPFMALRLTGVTFRQLDKIVLGLVVGSIAAAGFDVADKANLAPLTIIGVATSALIPAAAVGMRNSRRRTGQLLIAATRWSAILALPVAGLLAGLATPLSILLAGRTIAGTDTAMRWLLASTVLAVVAAAGFEMAMGAGAARRLAPISLCGLAVNVVATIVLVHQHGLPGSAAASFLAVLFEMPLQLVVIARVFDRRPSDLVRATAPGLVLGTAAFVPALLVAGHGRGFHAALAGGLAGAAGAGIVALIGVVRLPGRDRSLVTEWRAELAAPSDSAG